jgi:hypothetical protein
VNGQGFVLQPQPGAASHFNEPVVFSPLHHLDSPESVSSASTGAPLPGPAPCVPTVSKAEPPGLIIVATNGGTVMLRRGGSAPRSGLYAPEGSGSVEEAGSPLVQAPALALPHACSVCSCPEDSMKVLLKRPTLVTSDIVAELVVVDAREGLDGGSVGAGGLHPQLPLGRSCGDAAVARKLRLAGAAPRGQRSAWDVERTTALKGVHGRPWQLTCGALC